MTPVRLLIVLALLGVGTVPLPRAVPVQPDPPLPHELTQIHMGLPVRIRLYSPTVEIARTAATAAFSRVAALDQMMSDYRPDSELRRIGDTWRVVSPDLFAVVERASAIADATNGAFDPTVGPLVALWREARANQRMPERSALQSALSQVGWRHVQLDRSRRAVRLARPGMRLDLGGIAKGYILQQALDAMTPLGVTRALVEAGGDIVVGDAPPGRDGWRIEVEGADAAFVARAARLTHAALATSGPTAQFVEIAGVRYSHVIDPRTGMALTTGVTARVIAADSATADALATALTVADPKGRHHILSRFPGVAASLRD
jgi:thiamine biosynthesis lipoprotein